MRLQPGARIEVQVIPGGLLLKRPRTRLKLDRWVGYLKDSFAEMGFETEEEYIAAIRRGQAEQAPLPSHLSADDRRQGKIGVAW